MSAFILDGDGLDRISQRLLRSEDDLYVLYEVLQYSELLLSKLDDLSLKLEGTPTEVTSILLTFSFISRW